MSNNNPNQPRGSTNKMLIDATHPEETRVVVLRNGRVEEFDYESAARKLLRGNIYLAKVTRVEPSLQAAFVDYGGNRHGFLAFNEIHPDYYQIPIADRRALIEAEAAAEAEEEAAADRAAEAAAARRARRDQRDAERHGGHRNVEDGEDNAVDVTGLLPPEPVEAGADAPRDADEPPATSSFGRDEDEPRSMSERTEADPRISGEPDRPAAYDPEPTSRSAEPEHEGASRSSYQLHEATSEAGDQHGDHHVEQNGEGRREDSSRFESAEAPASTESEQVETVEAEEEDALEEVPVRPRRRLRSYKIQEVTKRRQVLLVQVVKEERGTKGAALTTYLSLAGRYTVLMPNTARGGGISRKISNPQDRKRLKAIAAELDVPEGMGLIIRTAGAARTKQEIKRDYEYLLRLWESVRELALNSNAPALVYEEGNLIKRSIRDLYGKEVEEIVVAGDGAYREAKDFMRMLLPSHAKNVMHYQDAEPLFSRFQIERQLNAMFSPYVHLKSGGYLVINQTEALVAIDINSGKSTREFSIEETAYSTNMEAADEIARQLKLRDLAGLIVIDFIDMEEKRNNRAVERRIKDALRHDRARIQLGHISHFGLMEMSRQRMRTGVLEGSTSQCPHCQGTGIIRSTESVALAVLRGVEDALMAGQPASLNVSTTATVALYILNNKRSFITEIENRYGITVHVLASEKMQGANFAIERTSRRDDAPRRPERTAVNMEWGFEDEADDAAAPVEQVDEDEVEERGRGPATAASDDGEAGGQGDGRRRRRRRRGRRGESEGGPRHQGDRPRRDDEHARFAGGEGDEGRGERDDGEPARREVAYADQDRDDDNGEREGPAREARDGEPPGGEGQEGGRRGRRRRRGRRGGKRGPERGEHGAAEGTAASGAYETGADEVGHDNGGSSNGRGVDDDRLHRPASEPVEPAHWQTVEVVTPTAAPYASPAYAEAHGSVAASVVPEVTPVSVEPVSVEPVSVEPVSVEPVRVEPARAEPAPLSPRADPVASEPVLARVVVGPDNSMVQEAQEAARPARRGWWQRK